MLEVQKIISHKQEYVQSLKKRGMDVEKKLDQIIVLDQDRRAIQTKLDSTLAESNRLSKEIGAYFKKGAKQEANTLQEESAALKSQAKHLSSKLENIQEEISERLYTIPNVPHESVPNGKREKDNVIVFEQQAVHELDSSALPHWDLAKKYNCIDFELGSKLTGSGFPVYKGKGARLQRALINYFLEKNREAGYNEVQVPHLVNSESALATGQLPDKDGQMYYVTQDNLYLIPTAEVPITNMYRNNLIPEKDLPICKTSYTPCFRREAGSYGAHVRGLNRLHQFDKVEIVRIDTPENSYKSLTSMVDHVKALLQELKLPYRILRLCGGDLGFTAALTYDFEVFSAAQKKWLEVSSVSNFETYQSNRLKLKYKTKEGKKKLAHTLNGSALALPRILACILENFQTTDGIILPKVLIPYCGFKMIN